ncbi:MAG TPA: hypothetical protein VMU95_11130 [Trebonia sp.]|nr:hypothetical protein [Trebonia sp.]
MSPQEDRARPGSDPDDRHTERLVALGQVIELSVAMESRLRQAFCVLVESKYAAVVAGGQAAEWLIEQSKALVDAHHDMPDVDRQAIKAALNRCKAANEQRNHLAHSVAVGVKFNPAFQMVRSRRQRYSSDIRSFTLTEIRAAANELQSAGATLATVMTKVVGPDLVDIGEALALEDLLADEDLLAEDSPE